LISLPTITAKVGEGWDSPTAQEYFRTNNDDTNDQTGSLMSTLHQFKESHIMFSTMKRLKVTMNEKMRGFSSLTVTCQIMGLKTWQFASVTVNCSKMTIMNFMLMMI
jgi:hypothetical protein